LTSLARFADTAVSLADRASRTARPTLPGTAAAAARLGMPDPHRASSSLFSLRRAVELQALTPSPFHARSDDVEESTRGFDTFISTGLAPKRELRVVNADDD